MKLRKMFALATMLLSLSASAENRVKLTDGWRFMLGDNEQAKEVSYDDSKWHTVAVPHDWSILQPPSKDATPGNEGGYYEAGIGWYRLSLTPKMLSQMVCQDAACYWLNFDGVYQNATVYVNGVEAGRHDYGYTAFNIDITSQLDATKNNVIAVRVDNSEQKNCRWYSGSGIYRYVTLNSAPSIHLDSWQTSFIASANRSLTVEAMAINDGKSDAQATVSVSVAGHEAKANVQLKAGEKKLVTLKTNVPEAELWNTRNPKLYDATVALSCNGKVADKVERRIGFRSVEWDAVKGLRLNGEQILVNGACVHHDNGLLGAMATRSTEARKVMVMRQAGFNLLRTSHNPPSESFLDACDEQGMLVIDEAFDGWRTQKNPHDYHKIFDRDSRADVQSMVLRDRNHASVISWSIGNEVIERKDIRVVYTARQLKQAILEVDPEHRPVTEALCAWDRDWEIYDPHAEVLDIAGYNYMLFKHGDDHKRDPKRIIWQTESYPRDAFANWQTVRDYPYVVGDIVWTGLDYLGESGIGGWRYESWPQGEAWQNLQWPWHGAYCGDVDITGLRKPVSYYRDMLWNERDARQLYIATYEPDGYIEKIKTTMWSTWPTWRSWDWKGWEQKDIEVVAYSRQPKVRLSLLPAKGGDMQVIGEKPTTEKEQFKAVFRLPYQPGTLLAEGLDARGNVVCRDTLRSAAEPYAIRCHEEPQAIANPDMRFIVVEVVDKYGNPCTQSEATINVAIKGTAKMLAFGNADLRSFEDIHDLQHTLWHGRAMLIVSSGKGKITFSSKSLKSASL